MTTPILETPKAMMAYRSALKGRVGLVPTMGALHEGHLSLVRLARERCDLVGMSIFVNPAQFNESADFDKYPRQLARDVEMATAAGVDFFYAPSAGSMYPSGFGAYVAPEWPMASLWEGEFRPGHFRGVTTVVLKLFNAVQPDVAVFGLKDYQQYAILARMAEDLDLKVEVVGAPTLRDPDGLAMSSRNARLSAAERTLALEISSALSGAETAVLTQGRRDLDALRSELVDRHLSRPGMQLEYFAFVDPRTLQEMEPIHKADASSRDFDADGLQCIVAVKVGDTRLIDNHLIQGRPSLKFDRTS